MKVKVDITSKNMTVKSQKISTEDTCDENDNSSTEELYKRYNECRDYQLKQFWENSKFIWAFLLVCFGAYGAMCMSKDLCDETKKYLTDAMVLVSSLGVALSFVWLWMARASKAWYEVFEMAIWRIEDVENKLNREPELLIHNFWTIKREECWINPKNLFMTRPFSPSKIVIGIGWFLIVLWIGITLFSLFCLCNWNSFSIIVLFPIIGAILMRVFFIRSSTLRNLKEEKVYQNLKKDFAKLNIYFDVTGCKVTFYLTEERAKEQLNKINTTLNLTPTLDGLSAKYSYCKVKQHYNMLEKKIDYIRKIYANNDDFTIRIINSEDDKIVINTSEITKDYDKIKHINQKAIRIEDNKIIIPLDCIP